jgi:hypothetical protein
MVTKTKKIRIKPKSSKSKTFSSNRTLKALDHKGTASSLKTFSKEDYASSDGFLTSVWGPMLWSYLHTMSFNYPTEPTPENKKHYRDFVLNLRHVMPCKYCRMNLVKNLKELPLTVDHMKNRETFSRYIYNLHELVNKMLNKQSGLSYEDVRDRYENFRSRCTIEKLGERSSASLDPQTPPLKFKNGITKEDKVPMLNTNQPSEKGCTVPLYGKKSKCVIKIVPQEEKQETFQMDKKCIKIRAT